MMAKPMKTLELHYPMIQFLNKQVYALFIIVRGFSLSIPPICRTPRVMAIPLLQEFQTLRQGM